MIIKMQNNKVKVLNINREIKLVCIWNFAEAFSHIYRIALGKRNFTLKYDTNIPRQVVSE